MLKREEIVIQPIIHEKISEQLMKLEDEYHKIKNVDLTPENFKKIKMKDDMILYYFPTECPDYTKDIFVHVITSKSLDRYLLPEEKTLIIVKKDHKWTKEPIGFIYWSTV